MSSLRQTVAEILTFKVTLAFWPFLSLHKIVFFPSHTSILAEVTHVYANIHIPKFHTCQLSRFTVMVVQSFKKCKFFNKNYCENFSKKLKKKFSSGFLSWKYKIISNFLDPPLWRPFFEKFSLIFPPKIWLKNLHFLKLWTTITVKRLDWQVWNFAIWIYA